MLKRRFCTLGLLCFFMMSQVFAASGELSNTGSTIGEDSIQEDSIQEKIIIPEIIDIPDFQVQFQNPSYIFEKDIIKGEYFCNSEKDICKINTKIIELGGVDIGKEFGCEIIYSHSFDIDNRCNPTTFILDKDIQVVYKIFEKNNPENFKEKEIIFKIAENSTEEIIENQENTGTGSTDNGENENNLETGTGSVNENTATGSIENIAETGSGIIDENTSTGTIEPEIILIPEIILEIQSGLEYSGTGNVYDCKKEECKINLDISESFTGSFLEKNYICEWNFGSGSFSVADTDLKCNPGYVNYGTGFFEVSAQIIEKDNNDNFIEKIFFIKNITENINTEDIVESGTGSQEIIEDQENTGTGSIGDSGDDNTATGSVENIQETGSGIIEENTNTGAIELEITPLPEIILEIQSGLDYSGTENIYNCKKEECKINLDITESFTGNFLEKNYNCEWNFGSGNSSVANTDSKCNPGYVEYSLGDHKISVKIIDKNNGENYTEKSIFIENKKVIIIKKISTKLGGGGGSSSGKSSKKIIIDVSLKKIIEIQSGLNNQNICDEKICKINLLYDNSSYETCEWDFDGIEVKESYKTSCNPGFIYYPSGKYKITLQVNNTKINSIHYKTLSINNINKNKENITKDNIEGNINGVKIEEGIDKLKLDNAIKEIDFKIELQGKKLKYKKYIGDKIICFGVEKCSINLKMKQSKKYLYYWDFGNGELSSKSNPKSIWYNSGSYIINLTIQQENNIIFQKNISVEVIPKIITKEQKIIAKEFISENEKFLSFETEDFYKKPSLYYKNFSDIVSKKNREKIIKDIEKQGGKIKKNIIKNTKILLEPKIFTLWFNHDNYIPKLKLTRIVLQQNKGLKFTGKTLPNATVFISGGEKIIEIQADNSGKYELLETDISSGKYALEYYVLDENGYFFQAKTMKNIEISKEYVVKVQQKLLVQKNKNKCKKKKSNQEKIITKKIRLYEENIGSDNIEKSGGGNYISFKNRGIGKNIFLILLSILSILGTIILLKKYKIL